MKLARRPDFTTLLPRVACGALLAFFAAHAQAPNDFRVALVIGNGLYPMAPLANPGNDARAMGDELRKTGFIVFEARDASKAEMEAALSRARQALQGRNGVALLYYAGHGLQLDWRNYMVPVDARLISASDVPRQTVDVQTVLDSFKSAGARMLIIVLDACRDNPFTAPASARGLAPMDAPPGTFLAFATAPGNVAEDGSDLGTNGLYTRFLLEGLRQPAAKIEDVFKRVRLNVRKQSQGRQVPWESTSLEDDFYFLPGATPAKETDTDRRAALKLEIADWDKIKASRNADDFYAFLKKYPSGAISEKAQFELDRLQATSVKFEPGRDGIVPLESGVARYGRGDLFTYAVSDLYGKEQAARRLLVTEVSDSRVVINNGKEVWDDMGNLVTDGSGTRSPAKIQFPSELSVGKKWRSAYEIIRQDGTMESLFWDFKVQGLETVSVPAGSFRAFRVEGVSRVSTGSYQTQTYWVEPTTFFTIRDDYVRRRGRVIEASHQRMLSSVARADRPSLPR